MLGWDSTVRVSRDRRESDAARWNWLLQYGLATDGSADHLTNSGTGMVVWQDYIAGCNPTNPASVFAITQTACDPSSGGLVVYWPSISNRFYDLNRATNLLAGTNAFIIIPGASNMPASPPENSYTDSVPGIGPVFYRIDVHK